MTAWYDCLSQSANWWTIGLVFVLCLVCNFGFVARYRALQRQTEIGNLKLLDGRWWYTPEDAAELLRKLRKDGRNFYAWSELTLDLIFPFAYGILFALLLVRLWPQECAWLLLLPLVAVIADLLENLTIAILAWRYDDADDAPTLAKPAAILGLVKHVFLVLVGLALLLGVGNATIGIDRLLAGIAAVLVAVVAVAIVLAVIKWPFAALVAAAAVVVIAALTVGVVPFLAGLGTLVVVILAVLAGVLSALS